MKYCSDCGAKMAPWEPVPGTCQWTATSQCDNGHKWSVTRGDAMGGSHDDFYRTPKPRPRLNAEDAKLLRSIL